MNAATKIGLKLVVHINSWLALARNSIIFEKSLWWRPLLDVYTQTGRSSLAFQRGGPAIIVLILVTTLILATEAQSEVSVRNHDAVLDPSGFQILEAPHLFISGVITGETANRVNQLIGRAQNASSMSYSSGDPVLSVILDSPGGDVTAAIEIGRLFRKHFASTYVMSGSNCNSACVLAFMGGVRRTLPADSTIGLHRPRFKNQASFADLSADEAFKEYDSLANETLEYFEEMRVSTRVFEIMMSVSSGDIKYLSAEDASQIGLTGEDPNFAEWQKAIFCEWAASSGYLPSDVPPWDKCS